jgi:AraC-like DNA-binding protein
MEVHIRMHRQLATKSFFRRFLFSYLLILTVPVLTICLTYSVAQQSIREEIVRANVNSLRQFADIADSRLSVMAATVREVLQNATVRDFANTYDNRDDRYGYMAYQVNNYLIGLPNTNFSDLFVYFMGSDYIISAFKAGLPSELYMDVYYNFTPGTGEPDWNRKALLTLGTPNVPMLRMLNPNATQTHLALMYAQNSGYVRGTSNLVACAVLQPEHLNDTLASAKYHPESVVGILDPDGKILSASGHFPDNFVNTELMHPSHMAEEGDHVYQYLPSGVADCRYVIATPRAIFWQRLNSLRIISFGSLLLCLLVSAYFAVLLARRNYLPIHTVLDTIYRKTHQLPDAEDKNEMEFIHHVLARSLEENDLLASRMESDSNTLREDFLLRALAGTCTGDREEDAFAAANIHLLSDRFCVLLIQLDYPMDTTAAAPLDPATHHKLSTSCGDLFQQQMEAGHKAYLVSLSPLRYAGILNLSNECEPDTCREDILTLCGRLSLSILKECGCPCTIGLSRIRTGLPGIHVAYEQAQQTMKYRYLFGTGSIIRHEDISERTFQFDHASESRASTLMLCHVQGNSEASAADVVEQVKACSPIDETVSMETVECFKYDLIGSVNRILHETGTLRVEKEEHLIHALITADTIQQFWTRLANTLELLRQHHASNKTHFTVCDRAAEYVRQHFSDPNLNNTGIGEALNISPSYLAKLFKEQRGLSLSDHLARIRVLHAKKMLANTPDTIEEIAVASGFFSGGTFIKTFKKMEGITPGAFRKLSTGTDTPPTGSHGVA